MSYSAVRFSAGRKGWAVVLVLHSPSGERRFIKKDLTKKQAHNITKMFNQELGYAE